MRYLLVCLIFLLFTPQIYSSEEMDARAALALAMSQPISAPPDPPKPIAVDPYVNARKMAIVSDKPLVVFLGCPSRELPDSNALVLSVSSLDGFTGPRIVIGKPGFDKDGNKTLLYAADLAGTASDQDIYDVTDDVRKQKVIQQVITGAFCVGGS